MDDSSDAGDLRVCGDTDGLSRWENESSQAWTSMWVLSDSGHGVDGDSVKEELVSQLTDGHKSHCDGMNGVHVVDLPSSQHNRVPIPVSSFEETQTYPIPTPGSSSEEPQTDSDLALASCHGDLAETQTVPVIDPDTPQTFGRRHVGPQSDLPRYVSDHATV